MIRIHSSICCDLFLSRELLYIHFPKYRAFVSIMPTFRFCESCKQYFEEELEIHQMNCTNSSDDANQCVETNHSSNSERVQSLDQNLVENKLTCEFCSGMFSTEEELNIHQEVCKHEEVKCEKCNVRVKRRNMPKHSIKVHLKECYYCGKEMEEEELKVHSSTCDLSLVRCEKCIARIPKRYMAHHVTADCVKRMIQCEYCNSDMVADTLQEHFEVCTLIPVYCENKCGQEMRRNELEQHLHEECPRREVGCKYCANKLEFELLETHYSECEKFPVACPKVCGESVPREDMERHLDEACKKSYTKCMYQAVSCTFEGFPVDIRKHIKEKNDFHAQVTNNKIENLSVIVENQKGVINTLERKLKETEETLERSKRETDKTTEKLSELELNLKLISTPGTFLWRITGSSRAIVGINHNIAFYDSKYGYKFRVWELILGGNLYSSFSLCSGENDEKLQWPFQKRITFKLIDKTRRVTDRTLLSVTGSTDVYFEKPVKYSENRSYSRKVLVQGFESYVCDDAILIEIKVE